ncbi:hypothetical protein PMZ80_005503 [Knufia obscura]|uniref:RBR-type E3 ubiquitin transferase n=1 Tax=Knufia obscura TaxID=1635080 RepID=A0ABR0RMQ6_9EURO|nr:hypothetical protein PMZ80_005503 [Knufia obscura]
MSSRSSQLYCKHTIILFNDIEHQLTTSSHNNLQLYHIAMASPTTTDEVTPSVTATTTEATPAIPSNTTSTESQDAPDNPTRDTTSQPGRLAGSLPHRPPPSPQPNAPHDNEEYTAIDTDSALALGVKRRRYEQERTGHRASTFAPVSVLPSSSRANLIVSSCIKQISLYSSRAVKKIFHEQLGRQVQRQGNQYSTLDYTSGVLSISNISLLVFLDKSALAKHFWDSAAVAQELQQVYPGLLRIRRFPGWDSSQDDILQICIRTIPRLPGVGEHGISRFQWEIWHIAKQQLQQGIHATVSGDVDVFWDGLRPEGYTTGTVQVEPGFSASWFTDNSHTVEESTHVRLLATASRIAPSRLTVVLNGKAEKAELCVVCKSKVLVASTIRTPGDTYCCPPCHARLFEKCHICTEFTHIPRLNLVPCGHKLCTECLVHAFHSGTSDMHSFPPQCCTQALVPHTYRKIIPRDVLIRYSELLQKYAEQRDISCATSSCNNAIKEYSISDQWGLCGLCLNFTCSLCGHAESDHKSTAEPRLCPKTKADEQVVELAKTSGWQECPKCKNMVERIDGCNSMTCRCGQGFCYTCGQPFEVERSCGCPVQYEGGDDDDGTGLWVDLAEGLVRLERQAETGNRSAVTRLRGLRHMATSRRMEITESASLSDWAINSIGRFEAGDEADLQRLSEALDELANHLLWMEEWTDPECEHLHIHMVDGGRCQGCLSEMPLLAQCGACHISMCLSCCVNLRFRSVARASSPGSGAIDGMG